jgi:hypothetical protein
MRVLPTAKTGKVLRALAPAIHARRWWLSEQQILSRQPKARLGSVRRRKIARRSPTSECTPQVRDGKLPDVPQECGILIDAAPEEDYYKIIGGRWAGQYSGDGCSMLCKLICNRDLSPRRERLLHAPAHGDVAKLFSVEEQCGAVFHFTCLFDIDCFNRFLLQLHFAD